MKNYNMILKERQKLSALSSGKIDKYENLTSEEQANFGYSPLGKALKNKRKTPWCLKGALMQVLKSP